MKVLVTTSHFAQTNSSPLEVLKGAGLEFMLNPYKRKLAEEEISEILSSEEFVGLLAGTEPLNSSVLSCGETLRVISRVGVGLDNIDLAAAKQKNIKVYNTPQILTNSVSELTIGLILDVLRGISTQSQQVKAKTWKKRQGALLFGRRVGLIGFGAIGRRVAHLLKAFGANIIFSDISEIDCEFEQVSQERLLRESDIISLHVSSSDVLLSREAFGQMKKGVIIVNTSRGTAIDEEALIGSLESRQVGGAGMDVYSEEPYVGRLVAFENVVLTPHIGSYAKEAREEMELLSVSNLLTGLKEVGVL